MIDWTNPFDKVSQFFTVKDAIYLPRWDRLAIEDDGLDEHAKAGLVDLFTRVDSVCVWAEANPVVHVSFRPWKYNIKVGGAPQSAHVARKILLVNQWIPIAATDLHFDGKDCDKIRKELIKSGLLERLKLRMESNMGGWIHLDNRPLFPGGRRVFSP